MMKVTGMLVIANIVEQRTTGANDFSPNASCTGIAMGCNVQQAIELLTMQKQHAAIITQR